MKKILAIFLTLTFLATAVVPVMAEDVVEDTVVLNEVEHSIEAYRAVGNKTVIKGSTVANDEMAYYVTPNGATQKTNTQSTILSSKQNLVIAKFPIPEAKPGKYLDRYVIQFIAQDTSGSAISVLKLEGTDYDFKTLTSKDERIQNILSNRASYVATDHPVIGEKHETLSSIYRNFADVTTYAKECADKGQEYFYVIVGCTSSTRNMMFNVTWSEYIKQDTYHAYYYNFASEFPFELVDETIQGGEQAFPSDGEISWEFTNDIMDFTAKANGKDVRVTIDGTKVTLADPLEEITDYELTIEARDPWDEIITKTYKFSTGFKTGATGPEVPVLGAYDLKTQVEFMGDGYGLMELSFYLLTEFEDANEALELRDSEGNDTGVEFIYYDYNQRYDITEPLDLVDDEAYELVLKAGVCDIHGNALEEDLVLSKFYGGETPVEPNAEDGSFLIGYDYENSKILLVFANPAYTNRFVDVKIAKNGEVIFDDAFMTSKKGLLEAIELPVTMGDYDVSVRPHNAPDSYGESFTFVSVADMENLWKMLAINAGEKAHEAIVDNWEYITYTFGFTNKYLADVSDMETFAKKIIAFREGSGLTEDIDTESLLLMNNVIFNAAYFTLLENSADIDNTKKLIADCEANILELNKEVYDLWKKALDSKYANATVQAFIDSDEKLNSVKGLINVMIEALDVYKCGVLLDRIAAPANKSEVEQILSVEENLELLGVISFAERYNALNDKDALIDAISGKAYADSDAFADAFDKALVDAEENDDDNDDDKEKEDKPSKKPSSSSGGRGSSSTTGTQFMSSVPSSQTPFVTFTDIENVAWAKDHIIKLYNTGVINGKTATEFAPNDNITREEFTKLIVSMTKLTGDSELTFADVPADSWFASYVKAAVSNGVVNGIGNGLFGAGSNATRQDIAVMIVNALKAKGVQITSETANFADNASIADYAKEAVAFLNAKGVITGDESANFNPTAKATRAEVAVMLSRLNDIFMKEVK